LRLLGVSIRTGAVSVTFGASPIELVEPVVINPATRWARYVPHLWLVPSTIAFFPASKLHAR
jgi:hypothetical protein